MAHEALAVMRFKSNTGLPADTIEMSFAFASPSETGGSGGSAVAALNNFLNGTGSGVGSLGSMLAGSLNHSTNAVECDVYDISGSLGGGHRGSPVATSTMTIGDSPSVDTDLPLQACIGLSFHASLSGIPELGPVVADIPTPEQAQDYGAPAVHSGTSRPKSSRRGRIFFGPLNEAAMDSRVDRIRVPGADFKTIAIYALEGLAATTEGFSVWSRREAALHPVVAGWIADETDVVRRRRLKATTRTLWP